MGEWLLYGALANIALCFACLFSLLLATQGNRIQLVFLTFCLKSFLVQQTERISRVINMMASFFHF